MFDAADDIQSQTIQARSIQARTIQARGASKGVAGFLTATCQFIANRHDTLAGVSCLYFSLSKDKCKLYGATQQVNAWSSRYPNAMPTACQATRQLVVVAASQ